jgi:hypothetical protein
MKMHFLNPKAKEGIIFKGIVKIWVNKEGSVYYALASLPTKHLRLKFDFHQISKNNENTNLRTFTI